ncbi:hypothetical protein CASFOL_039726 [Castilleja foliolosa]|uniref:Myb-like domain-containing protein n=1 Tax=Castilleja foliolosa TaxID=1961234 RepID=A0ABD3BGX0_9LAMI
MASPSSSTPSPTPPLSPQPELLLLPAPTSKPVSPPKKPAPLPWSHPETLALIQAYQEKWYSVNRGPLKSFQWEEISVTVAARCGFDEPSRTSTQCRHKMEKLRKRYRSDMQKPHPNSWQYFELMDQLERGPMPLAIVKSSSPNYGSKIYNNDVNNSYGRFYSGSGDYFNKNHNNLGNGDGDGDGSDESDEEWNKGLELSKKNKSKGISSNNNNYNHNRRSDGKSGFTAAKMMNGKRGFSYDSVNSDDDEDDDDFVDEDKTGLDEEVDEGSGEKELAAEIRGFAERFMRMENKKIEMMRETERYWMEMEKKRMDMILENHRKIINSISNAFGARKKAKMVDES